MQKIFIILIVNLAYVSAHAQAYPPPYEKHITPQQIEAHLQAAQPAYPPQTLAPAPEPIQIAPPAETRPGEYGVSVITDIRQMNF